MYLDKTIKMNIRNLILLLLVFTVFSCINDTSDNEEGVKESIEEEEKEDIVDQDVDVPNDYEVIASSTSYDDVLTAVNSASVGETVFIPPGTSDWGVNTLTVPGGISIIGAGSENTIIKRTLSTSKYLIQFDGSNGLANELQGIAFEGHYNNDAVYGNGVAFTKGCIDFKVSNCKFSGFVNAALTIGYSNVQRGVIYSNEFINNYDEAIKNLGYAVVVYGDDVWLTLELGTENAVFVEDNIFSGNRHHIASNNSSRYVFRYNSVEHTDLVKNYAMTDVHGRSSSPMGSRSYEIYNNNYTTTVSQTRTAIGIRGGDGVIFNNTCSKDIYRTIELWTEGFSCGAYPGINQIRSLYIWRNDSHDEHGMTVNGIANQCEVSIKKDRDYFLMEKPGYTPYTYPHPLRSIK